MRSGLCGGSETNPAAVKEVLDSEMPNVSSYELARVLKKQNPPCKMP